MKFALLKVPTLQRAVSQRNGVIKQKKNIIFIVKKHFFFFENCHIWRRHSSAPSFWRKEIQKNYIKFFSPSCTAAAAKSQPLSRSIFLVMVRVCGKSRLVKKVWHPLWCEEWNLKWIYLSWGSAKLSRKNIFFFCFCTTNSTLEVETKSAETTTREKNILATYTQPYAATSSISILHVPIEQTVTAPNRKLRL